MGFRFNVAVRLEQVEKGVEEAVGVPANLATAAAALRIRLGAFF